ncbi:MAG: hypothetical protein ABH889_01280 [Candidatus Portnoybacteria bacterium]
MSNQQNNQSKQKLLGLYGLGDYNTQQIKIFARSFEIEGLSPKEFYDRRPDATLNPIEYIKSMTPETASLIVPDAFAGKIGIDLLKNMTIEQLEKIGAGDDPFLKLAIKNTFERLLALEIEKNNPKIEKIYQYLTYSPAWQF